jgi:6-phosphofructokinase
MNIGVLCGGGPAPGFNGVIHAVVNAAHELDWKVTGIPYGYRDLMRGDTSNAMELRPKDVDGIEVTGGSILFTARDNPKKSPDTMDNVVAACKSLGLDALVTIGGDDTATSAANVADAIGGGFRVAHVPKTIDNDLPLPDGAPTFGYHTAAELGGLLVHNLKVDAITTSRWYFVSAMGRSAGHLALGMAEHGDADLCLIREEFEFAGTSLAALAELVEYAILKRREEGQNGGVVVLAEGILEKLPQSELQSIGDLELDEHGNPRMSEIDLGKAIRDAVKTRMGDKAPGFVTKLIGYELRCADPCPFDVAYTGNLGLSAVEFLNAGEGHGIICFIDGASKVLRFEDLRDAETGRIPVRRVDLASREWTESLARQAR